MYQIPILPALMNRITTFNLKKFGIVGKRYLKTKNPINKLEQ